MSSSVVPSFHGYSVFLLSDSRSTRPPPHLPLIVKPPLLSVLQTRKTRSCDGLVVCAVKNRRKVRGNDVVEMDGFYDDDVDAEDENEEQEEEEEAEDDEMLLPFGKMKKWLDNKPPGFGVGKVYDTSIEDKLLDEILQSQQAQAANINKLKNSPVKPIPYNPPPRLKVSEETPTGIRVRVGNLPKKRNIHRDLKLAFGGAPGILNIVPAVSGNSKTRDPVCKGFAFVDFKSDEDAFRFVQTFSRQSMTFGKVKKQIKCELMNHSPIAADGESVNETSVAVAVAAAAQQMDHGLEGKPAASSVVDDSFSDSWEDLATDEGNDLDGDVEAEFEETYEDMENMISSELDPDKSMDIGSESLSASFSPEPKNRIAVSTKKQGGKQVKRQKSGGKANGLKVKVPKLEVPGYAKRLKIKEKAALTEVFSKYGTRSGLTSSSSES
ncbi:hypothetical protein SAY86_019662 [Trapa natans]|uniref:RRM domain-containing protein n=1 Tax=Trapa natans TaxID=22666 RepID=A0AAN7R707_TRANT|nr:hypothetical protein SAY86_019662 [Trapa natans]